MILILFFLSFFTIDVHAQGNGGVGGGGIVICPDPKHPSQQLAYPHEIYQGRFAYRFKKIYRMSPRELENFLHKRLIPEEFENEFNAVSAEYEAFLEKGRSAIKNRSTIEVDSILSSLQDQKELLTPDLSYEFQSKEPYQFNDGCKIKNGFRFYFGNTVETDENVLSHLVHYSHDLVIMRWHEVMYRLSRILHRARTSEQTRELLMKACADETQISWFSGDPDLDYFSFQTSYHKFWNTKDDWSKNLDILYLRGYLVPVPAQDTSVTDFLSPR